MSSLRSGLRCGSRLKGAACVELAALWTPLRSLPEGGLRVLSLLRSGLRCGRCLKGGCVY